jgi:hypothetical protein
MKKLSLFLSILLLSSVAFGQFDPGTAESMGFGGEREITANGLTPLYSVTGNYYLSADGGGNQSGPYTISVNKPSAGATVHKAYIMAASTGFSSYSVPNGCITLNGTGINWDFTQASGIFSFNHYADITAFIAGIMNPAGPGITNLNVTECSYSFNDGIALLVVFADAAASEKTIVIMFGALSTTGDNFSISLGTPIDPNEPGAQLNMGLGISFGYQINGGGQVTLVDINGTRLTSSAGGQDDGSVNNGGLITVGGIGDVNTNPPDPFAPPVNQFSDDELYSLLPFITNATLNILVNTLNPSSDDNVFLSYFEISGAAIIGEGILLSQTTNVETVGTTHTVKALIQDDDGNPVAGKQVDFTVLSGPNAGDNGSDVTDANGEAFFTYTGDGGVGFDQIQGCFFDSLNNYECSNILTVEWITGGGPAVPVSNWALFIGIALILAFAIFRFRR